MIEYRKRYGGRNCLIVDLSEEDPYSESIYSGWRELSHPAAAECIRVWYNGGVRLLFPQEEGWVTMREKKAHMPEAGALNGILTELAEFLKFLRTSTEIPYDALCLSEDEILIGAQDRIYVRCMPVPAENGASEEAYFAAEAKLRALIDERTGVRPEEQRKETLTITGVDTPEPVCFTVAQEEFVLGKSGQRSDGVIPGVSTISRAHAKLSRRNGHWYVTDLQSANGTCVNGVRIPPMQPVELKAGTVLKLANYTFLVR